MNFFHFKKKTNIILYIHYEFGQIYQVKLEYFIKFRDLFYHILLDPKIGKIPPAEMAQKTLET